MSKNILCDNSEATKNVQPLSSYSWFFPYFILPFRKVSAKATFGFVKEVLVNFFALQFLEKLQIYHIPIVNVQVKEDDNIPFMPEKVDTYMHFINFWLSPMTMLFKRLGIKKALPIATDFMKHITNAYVQAAKVYKFRLTTTNRPKYTKNLKFFLIHSFDPHYLCVPSLHVAIVVLCYSFYKNLFEKIDVEFSEEEKSAWTKELFDGAVKIIESVLFVKQHSVNCVPAALYMMTRITEFFKTEDAVTFITNLFINKTELPKTNCDTVREHFFYMLDMLTLEGSQEECWEVPVQRWIYNHQAKTSNK